VSDIGHRVTFRTDRLGMPLVETVTEPDLLTPYDAAHGGFLLARVARASGKVRRGAGAARQDVNVSVAGSRRVEIKGVHHHRGLPLLVHHEAYRHLNLLRIREELRRRGIEASLLEISPTASPLSSSLVMDAFPIVRATDYPPLQGAVERREAVWAVRLPGFGGLLAHRTQPGLAFDQELRERVRVIACLTARPFLATSDTEPDEIGDGWHRLRRALHADEQDALVVVWGPDDDLETAVREILIRATEALVGVPSETRQAWPDGTTGFERILPGPERMYPDTDTPPLPIPDKWLEDMDRTIGDPPWVREARYVAAGLSEDEAFALASARWSDLYDALAPATPELSRRLAAAFAKRLVHWWREIGEIRLPEAVRIAPLVRAIEEGRALPDGLEPALDRLLREADDAELIVAAHAHADNDDKRLERHLATLAGRRSELRTDDHGAALRWGMGIVMRPLRGKFAPEEIRIRVAAVLESEEVTV
jgi:glutamyl-tRNA(Gln) amidotransferase subunit E